MEKEAKKDRAADKRRAERELASVEKDKEAVKKRTERELQQAQKAREELQSLRAAVSQEKRQKEILEMSTKQRGQLGYRADGVTKLDERAQIYC